MSALIQAKLTPQAAIASMTTGRRFGGDDAARYGLVDAAAAEDAVVADAIRHGDSVGGQGLWDPGRDQGDHVRPSCGGPGSRLVGRALASEAAA